MPSTEGSFISGKGLGSGGKGGVSRCASDIGVDTAGVLCGGESSRELAADEAIKGAPIYDTSPTHSTALSGATFFMVTVAIATIGIFVEVDAQSVAVRCMAATALVGKTFAKRRRSRVGDGEVKIVTFCKILTTPSPSTSIFRYLYFPLSILMNSLPITESFR